MNDTTKKRKGTFVLYRAHADEWADLPYKDALKKRIECAAKAMLYYKTLATNMEQYTYQYDIVINRYNDSEKARKWNERDLAEAKEEKDLNERDLKETETKKV